MSQRNDIPYLSTFIELRERNKARLNFLPSRILSWLNKLIEEAEL